MSKLDDILQECVEAEGVPMNTKQQIKDLFLDLIDKVDSDMGVPESRTDRLRRKVEEL